MNHLERQAARVAAQFLYLAARKAGDGSDRMRQRFYRLRDAVQEAGDNATEADVWRMRQAERVARDLAAVSDYLSDEAQGFTMQAEDYA